MILTGVLDRKTRGRTSPHRLRALDAYLCRRERDLLARRDGPWAQAVFVDVGFGAHPWTTLESARAFREVHPGLEVVGVELDGQRAEAAAAAHGDARTHFRQGGFELPLLPTESVRLIRAMNLLRSGYDPQLVSAVHRRLGEVVLPGGLLVEGSSDTSGAVLAAHLLRRHPDALVREALLFHTDFSRGFAPLLFRDWLPRDLRRRVVPGEAIHSFFAAWTQAWHEARAAGAAPPREIFGRSLIELTRRCEGVETDAWLVEQGYLLWRPPGGVCP